MTKRFATLFIFILFCFRILLSASTCPVKTKYLNNLPQYVQYHKTPECFCIAENNKTATICVSTEDFAGVKRAAEDLCNDIERVTGTKAKIAITEKPDSGAIIIGTIGKSKLIDKLIKNKKLDISDIKGNGNRLLFRQQTEI